LSSASLVENACAEFPDNAFDSDGEEEYIVDDSSAADNIINDCEACSSDDTSVASNDGESSEEALDALVTEGHKEKRAMRL
jgi:hypothetical protein